MHSKYFFVLLVLIIVFAPIILNAQTLPFGGQVTYTQPCNTGLLLYVLQPLKGVQTYMWFTGNLPYLMRTVPHIGQNLLGMASPGPVPCVLGTIPMGSGFPIIYHGGSI